MAKTQPAPEPTISPEKVAEYANAFGVDVPDTAAREPKEGPAPEEPAQLINLIEGVNSREELWQRRMIITELPPPPPPLERTERQQTRLELEQAAGRRRVEALAAGGVVERTRSPAEAKAEGSSTPAFRPADGAGSKDREPAKAR